MRFAIQNAKDTAPWPDGILFKAYALTVNLATGVLYDAARVLCGERGTERMLLEYPDFNASLLFFLPKKACGTTPTGEGIYESSNTRP